MITFVCGRKRKDGCDIIIEDDDVLTTAGIMLRGWMSSQFRQMGHFPTREERDIFWDSAVESAKKQSLKRTIKKR